jgi:hypothetical protein
MDGRVKREKTKRWSVMRERCILEEKEKQE